RDLNVEVECRKSSDPGSLTHQLKPCRTYQFSNISLLVLHRKESTPCSSTDDIRPRSPSPRNTSVFTKPTPTKPKSDSHPTSLTPVPDVQVDLFSTKKIRRTHSKPSGDPMPDVDKPLDRSSVSLRSLLNWAPVNKPPPTYRQNRTTASNNSAPSSEVVKKSDPSPVKHSPIIPNLASNSAPQSDLLAPQLRLDADGNIVLDETSLLVSLPETTMNTSGMRFVDEESGLLSVTYNSFRPQEKRGGRWDARETVRFYRALSTIGPDFYLMLKLFPNRNREELKRKFKRESRAHPYLVNQALRNRRSYDLTALVALSDEDEDDEKEEKKDVKEKIEKKPIVRSRRKRSPATKIQKTSRGSNNYDPNKVLETIDAVLAKETADDNVSGVLAVEAPSSGQTTCVLDRMIAAKQREVELETVGSTKIKQPSSRPTTRAHPQRTAIRRREAELMEYELVPALVTFPAAPLPASR
ncbi:Myb-like DNA-binding domain protein, partial [Opisthorchis viverrini]